MSQSLVPDNIEALAPYVPGKPIEELERELGLADIVKVASNENPLGPSPRAVEAAHRALAGSHLYPDASAHRLRAALAARAGVTPGEIMLGAGSNEIIDLLVRTFCRPGVDEVLTHRYAFMMYRVSCGAAGVTMREAEVTAELGCDVDALGAAVGPRTRLVFLPNPNNPTGSYVGRAAFEKLLARLPAHVILAVDEAYFEYAETIPDYPVAERYRKDATARVVSLRTFSKAYGLASMRVGFAIADAQICDYLNRVRMPFNVSTAAQEAALAAIDDVEHVRKSREQNAAGLLQLAAGLGRLPVVAYPSAGNFVLVDLQREAGPVYQALLKKGVIARPLAPTGLTRHLRISVGTAVENARVLAALGEVLR